MNRPRIDLGLESSSSALDVEVARRIGRQLTRARTTSGLSLATIEARLLLSRNQIRALEAADPGTFYNARFHAVALRKYAELLGVEAGGLDDLLLTPCLEDDAQGDRTGKVWDATVGIWRDTVAELWPRAVITLGAIVTILALVLIVGWQLAQADDVDQTASEITTSLSITAR